MLLGLVPRLLLPLMLLKAGAAGPSVSAETVHQPQLLSTFASAVSTPVNARLPADRHEAEVSDVVLMRSRQDAPAAVVAPDPRSCVTK